MLPEAILKSATFRASYIEYVGESGNVMKRDICIFSGKTLLMRLVSHKEASISGCAPAI